MKNIFYVLTSLFILILSITNLKAQAPVKTLANQLSVDTLGYPVTSQLYQQQTKDNSGNAYGIQDGYVTGQQSVYEVGKIHSGLVWVTTIYGPANSQTFGLGITEKAGYVYCTGFEQDTAGGSRAKIYTVKLNGNTGDTMWTRSYAGSYYGYASGATAAVDDTGNVYVVGTEQTAPTTFRMDLLKYDSTGNLLWVSSYDSSGLYSSGVALAINSGNVSITGFSGTTFTSWDFATAWFGFNGTLLSTARSGNGSGNFSKPVGIMRAKDQGIVIVGTAATTGINTNIKLVEYDSTFTQQWVTTYGDSSSLISASQASDDDNGHLIISGTANNSSGGTDMLAVTLNEMGSAMPTLNWAKRISAPDPTQNASAASINTDNNDNIIIAGKAFNNGHWGMVTGAFDITSGNQLWQKTFKRDVNTDDSASTVTLDDNNNVEVFGTSAGTNTIYTKVTYGEATSFIPNDTTDINSPFAFYENMGQLYSSDTLRSADSVFYYTTKGNVQLFMGSGKLSFVTGFTDTTHTYDSVSRFDMWLNGNTEGSYAKANIYPDKPVNPYINYYLGYMSNPATGVTGFDRVVQPGVYDGIDWQVCTTPQGIKNYFIVYPGAKADNIDLIFKGPDSISTAGNAMQIFTHAGYVQFDTLVAFTVDDTGAITPVSVSYNLLGLREYGFTLGAYNAGHTLVVEGKVKGLEGGNCQENLCWSTYFGGGGSDVGNDIETDQNGNLFITGNTGSTNFPTSASTTFTFGGVQDAFLSKFNSAGEAKWSNYYGAMSKNTSQTVVPTTGDNVYIAGSTNGNNLPIKNPGGGGGALNITAPANGYIAAFSSTTGFLNWASYYGTITSGFGNETFKSGAYNPNTDEVAFVGTTTSTVWPTQTSGNAGELLNNGGQGTILKLNNSNWNLLWATTVGDAASTTLNKCVYNSSNELYVVGTTAQFTTFTMSTTGSSYTQSYGGGATNGLVLRFNNVDNFEYGSFIGASSASQILGACVDPNQDLYICGSVSGSGNYKQQTLTGAFNQSGFNGGLSDGVVSKFAADGSLLWSTWYGGAGNESLTSMASDGYNNIYIVGDVNESGVTPPALPVANPTGAFSALANGSGNAYLITLNSNDALVWTTYFGGHNTTSPNSVSVGNNNTELYMTGFTNSKQGNTNPLDDFPLVFLENAYNQEFLGQDQTNSNTFLDAFISRFDLSVVNPSGISLVPGTALLQLFPNPTDDELNLKLTGDFVNSKATIEVINALGQVVLNREINTEIINTIKVCNLAEGVYFIRLATNEKNWTGKFVKQ